MDKQVKYEIHKSQLYYGNVAHWITTISCLIALIAPVFILLFPRSNLLAPNMVFGAIFKGLKPAEIWETSGAPYTYGDFWQLYIRNLLSPDGFATFGIVLGFCVTLLSFFPAVWIFIKKREFIYAGISLFVVALIVLAMSGLINMAG